MKQFDKQMVNSMVDDVQQKYENPDGSPLSREQAYLKAVLIRLELEQRSTEKRLHHAEILRSFVDELCPDLD